MKNIHDCAESYTTHTNRYVRAAEKFMENRSLLIDAVSIGLQRLYMYNPEEADKVMEDCNSILEYFKSSTDELLESVESFSDDIKDLSSIAISFELSKDLMALRDVLLEEE